MGWRRVINNTIVVFIFLIAGILTYYTYNKQFIYFITLSFLVWLISVNGIVASIIFYIQYRRAKKYADFYILRSSSKKYKIAAFVTSFNEDPEIVKATLISVLFAAKRYGNCDVFLLDDSTKKNISDELKSFCEKRGITYIHRTNRRGFKAGAINDALRRYGNYYDLVTIFDADQRPSPNFFQIVSAYFDDPSVAFVQIPQYYSETYTKIAKGAWYQQLPFLKIIMKGRNLISAFSLGSGTTFRVSALKEVGYLKEDTVTEDVATSAKLHAKGYKSIYINYSGIWYGEPPQDLSAYLKQQGRWSLGGFQLLKDLLKLDLPLIVFLDYFAGVIYWIRIGFLRLIEFLAPIVFIDFNVSYIVLNPILYAISYFPIVIITVIMYLWAMKDYDYGLYGFFLHQTVEILEFSAVLMSFIKWISRRKSIFVVTPKGKISMQVYLILPYITVLLILGLTLINGIIKVTLDITKTLLAYAIIINIIWILYYIPYLVYGIKISLEKPKEVNRNIIVEVPLIPVIEKE
ncbi:glycosyltransferase family 2 protein [Sulfolobaceae archaeon RB850M]